MRFNARPKSNQLTAIGNAIRVLSSVPSRGVEAALAASTQAGFTGTQKELHYLPGCLLHSELLRRKKNSSSALKCQLNFESGRDKNSMDVFMNRLRRVYQACTNKGGEVFAPVFGALASTVTGWRIVAEV